MYINNNIKLTKNTFAACAGDTLINFKFKKSLLEHRYNLMIYLNDKII